MHRPTALTRALVPVDDLTLPLHAVGCVDLLPRDLSLDGLRHGGLHRRLAVEDGEGETWVFRVGHRGSAWQAVLVEAVGQLQPTKSSRLVPYGRSPMRRLKDENLDITAVLLSPPMLLVWSLVAWPLGLLLSLLHVRDARRSREQVSPLATAALVISGFFAASTPVVIAIAFALDDVG